MAEETPKKTVIEILTHLIEEVGDVYTLGQTMKWVETEANYNRVKEKIETALAKENPGE